MIARIVMAVYHGVAEPLRALALKRSRLRAFGVDPDAPPAAIRVDPFRAGRCGPDCGYRDAVAAGFWSPTLDRYVDRAPDRLDAAPRPGWRERARRALRLTPMVIETGGFASIAGLHHLIRKRSARTLAKARRAREAGYAVRPFPLERHVYDVHAVKTSMRVRSAGPMLACWTLRPTDIAAPATGHTALPTPSCRHHWSMWWGVFEARPGHRQGGVAVDERLVAYIRTTRLGDVLIYADIMGHRDHLKHGVMMLAHLEVMRWVVEGRDPLAAGVEAVVYGAIEHGRSGLATWKKRAGFAPGRLVLAASRPAVAGGSDLAPARRAASAARG